MEVITTHINADFDSLGSMIAAKKLYPNAVLVFPGSQERSLRRFFLESVLYTVPFEKLKGIDMASVTRLILVDIRQWDRIGRFQQLVDDPNVEVHVYDHHPPTGRDIQGDVEVYKPYGASVTLMVELLRERSISLTPEEATVLMLGIYEDTGNLTFSSTTVNDLKAAAYLLECAADLNAVSNLITPELTQEQVGILNELIQTRKVYSVHGIEVNIADFVSDNTKRDASMYETMESVRFPKASFEIKESVAKGGNTYLLKGTMNLHGVSRAMNFEGSIAEEEGKVRIKAKSIMKMTDFGIKPPKMVFLTVRDQVDLSVDVVLKR